MYRLGSLLFAAVMVFALLPPSFAQERGPDKEFMIQLGDRDEGNAVLGICREEPVIIRKIETPLSGRFFRLDADGEDEDVKIIETDDGKRIVIRKKSDAPVSAG